MNHGTIPAWRKPIDAFLSSRPVSAVLRHVMPILDKPLMRLTKGRFSSTQSMGLPTLLLTTTGRKTGEPRSAPLLYLRHGDDLALIGTSFGNTSHPAWYLNLMANPKASVLLNDESFEVIAREASPDERPILWQQATQVYGGFEKYLKRVGDREVPILILTRIDEPDID
jgi:deazaflavin-dependent oxidoreductase (nitroreductase family)